MPSSDQFTTPFARRRDAGRGLFEVTEWVRGERKQSLCVCVRDPGEGTGRFDVLVVPVKTPYELEMFAWMRKRVLMTLGEEYRRCDVERGGRGGGAWSVTAGAQGAKAMVTRQLLLQMGQREGRRMPCGLERIGQ